MSASQSPSRALALGCVADDYTGASDLANTLTKAGLRTVQTIGVPADDLVLPEVDAVVVALKSRSVAPGEAVARSREADAWLRRRGANHVLFKVCSTFDSTDAGNIGPVLDALRADAAEPIALVTPAFPETGRSVCQGHLFVGATLLAESPLKDHPLNPMRDSNLVRVLARQSAGTVGLVDIATVAKGPEAVAARLDALAADGHGAAIADAIFESDLEILGRAALGHRVSCGASGLGLGLARALVADGRGAPAADAMAGEPVGGHAACLAGSCSQATLAQIEAAAAHMAVLHLDIEKLMAGPAEREATLAWAASRLADGPVLIASSAAPDAVRALQAKHGVAAVGHAVEAALAQLAADLFARGVRRLVVAGGETSGAVVDHLGLKAFLLGPEIAAGVPVLRTAGGDPMLLALKSGNFGGRDFFLRALDLMR
ncbi:3-oxo-tetronate kinase [Methylobacterium cerastii]|uniref:3-oxo-tetronate kinase n=1 Tax=Methylobacterium cerastii TaxID=932741 RepID=A0ABQ4QB32_9HYPH|nr:3-oxo-tetronate kinase [Methylobacterium cerastii]GJD42413.1 3-oxo-tetronate kinase [Methylobacterium cerastii]